jgi:hypothetical protein
MKSCPSCGKLDVRPSIVRETIPVLQNVAYLTPEEARAVRTGSLVLATCAACGFSFNAEFDPTRIDYDESYDNHVASDAFRNYYRQLAGWLLEKLSIQSGTIYEIGCGKGEFLKTLCRVAKQVRVVGIDPSCVPESGENYELVRTRFDRTAFQNDGDVKLVLLRHVLEHIDTPLQFLQELRATLSIAPLYVEVPDLGWILRERAFWDFCYEHCNYFTPDSLKYVLSAAGFRVADQGTSFGGQYQWALCYPDKASLTNVSPQRALDEVKLYQLQEGELLTQMADRAEARGGLAVWGMATKGVMLSNLLHPSNVLGGVDMNRLKQGKFCALSATAIHEPEWLKSLPAGTSVLVMNPNYFDEIRQLGRAISPTLHFELV